MAADTDYDNKENIYKEHLQKLSGIKFTFREIDVIACILHNRGEKKIASLLVISVRTVNSHVRNIMNKLGYSSREYIIDFVEKSGKLQYFRSHYFDLVSRSALEKQFQKIAATINRSGITCSVDYSNLSEVGDSLLQRIKHHLSLVNIALVGSKENAKNILYRLCVIGDQLTSNPDENNNIYLLLDSQTGIPSFNQLEYIDFTSKPDYYLSLFLLIKKIIANLALDTIIGKFIEEQNALRNSLEGKNIPTVEKSEQGNFDSKKHKFFPIITLLSAAVFSSFIFFVFVQKKFVQPTLEVAINSAVTDKTVEWNLPLFIEHYTQRHEITNAIWEKFKHDGNNQEKRKTAILAGLHGLGGIGKTTLAKHAIHHPQQHYSFKGWFSAETKELLQADYSELGEKYGLFTENISVKQKIELIKEWLEKQSRILLVYDNAPDMDMLKKYLPNRGDIIVTSRNHNLSGSIEIDVMTEEEATKLLENLAPQSAKKSVGYHQDLKKLATTLGYLPLALSQAGSYIAENSLTIQDYLSLYNTNKEELLSDKTMPAMDQHHSVYISWDLSIQKLKQQENGDNGLKILNFIACCYPEYIPNKLLTQYLYGKTDNESIIKLNKLLTLLRKYSLIKASADTVSMHRLVHAWLGSKLSKEKKLKVLEEAIRAIKIAYPCENQSPKDIIFIKLLVPHAETIFGQIQTIANEVGYAELFPILGDIYYSLGDYVKSRGVLEQGLNTYKKFHGSNDIKITQGLYILGKTYIRMGQYKESQALLEKALTIKQEYYGSNHIELANILSHLGRVKAYIGRYKESETLLKKALNIEQNHYGPEHIQIAAILHNLGRLYLSMGEYKRGKESYEKALKIKQKYYGLEYVETAHTLHQLGRAYSSLGKYKESKEILEKVLEIKQKYYGLEHVETAHTLHHLCRVYSFLGKHKESEEILEKVLAIRQKYYGLEHVETAHTLLYLGRIYLHLGKYKESKKMLDKSLVIRKKYYGQEHINSVDSLDGLGTYYLISGDYLKATELLTASYNIITKLYESDNIFTIKAAVNLGNVYRLLNNLGKSKELLEQSHASMEKLHDYDQLTAANVMGNLALLYGKLGDNNKRRDYLEKALAIFKEHLPPNHININKTISHLKNENDNTNIGYPVILLPW